MNVKKIAISAAVVFLMNMTYAQTVQEGINLIDSDKYALAKKNFTSMVSAAPTADNYFYLGNTYVSQAEPDFATATDNFNKGLAADAKSYLNKIGLATVKLGKGDKSGVTDIQKVVTDSKEKDTEVLYRAAEALTLFEKNSSADLAIQYLTKAIERAKKDVPAHFYYTLGDAYRLKRLPGDAMTAYEKALPLAKNKASVYTRIGSLWLAAQQWEQAKINIEKAIATDATYAPAYKAMAEFNMRYQENGKAAQNLIDYSKYADEDPYTQMDIAKLNFANGNFAQANQVLDKIFNDIKDPIKYKLKSYILYSEGKYSEAQQNMNTFVSQAEKSRIHPADQGLQGLIIGALAKTETDATKKSAMLNEAQQKVAIAKNAKDETLNWDVELANVLGGNTSQKAADEGPTNATIQDLKRQLATKPEDTDLLYKLASEYQNVKNWDGAIITWQKMSSLLPDWSPVYYSLGYAYQQAENNDAAKIAYDKFITTTKPADVEANKQLLAYAYFIVAYYEQSADPAKAKDYIGKAVQLDPSNQEAAKLHTVLNG